jgi:hypothetical protein
MRTPSIRTLAAIAYERGEEFDPALMLSPALAEQLDGSTAGGTAVLASSPSEKSRRLRERDIEGDGDEVYGKMGISSEALHELEECPFLDELTRLGHAPAAVLQAEHHVATARRNGDPVALQAAETALQEVEVPIAGA